MYRLSILVDDQEVVLQGPGAAGTVKGARRVASGAGGMAGQTTLLVEVLLEGAPDDILADAAALRRALEGATQLQLTPQENGTVYETPVRGGSLELPGEGSPARLRGSLTARLALETGGYWEGSESEIALNGAAGGAAVGNPAGVSGGAALEVGAGVLAGDLPAPFRLELAHAPGAPQPLGDVLVALDGHDGAGGAGLLLEGELGTGGVVYASAECSGGAFARCTAPAGQDTTLLTWTLPATLLANCAGRPLRAALRLAAGGAGSAGVWVYWQVRAGDASPAKALAETIAQRLEPGETLALLPALRLPGGPQTPLAPLSACLVAQADETATLDVDFLHLLPQDGFQRLSALWPLPAGETLVLDGAAGQVFQRGEEGCLPGHLAAGAPLRLHPARAQRLFVLHPGPVSTVLTARAWLRPRWSEV